MDPQPPSFPERLNQFSGYIEAGSLLLAVAGVVMFKLELAQGGQVLMIGLMAFAGILFLRAFSMPPATGETTPDNKDEPKGFADLFSTILRKLLYIGSAVSVVGILFFILHLAGAANMLVIGSGTVVLASVVSLLLVSRSNFASALLKGPLMRAVPIGLYALYALYRLQPVTF